VEIPFDVIFCIFMVEKQQFIYFHYVFNFDLNENVRIQVE
jgi:hypothetical protein